MKPFFIISNRQWLLKLLLQNILEIQGFFFLGRYENELENTRKLSSLFYCRIPITFSGKNSKKRNSLYCPFINGQPLFSSCTKNCRKKMQPMWQRSWIVFHSSIKQDWIPEKKLWSTKTNLEISDQTWKYCLVVLKGQHNFFHLTTIQLAMGLVRSFKSANTSPICPSADYFSKGKTWPLLE